MKGTLDSRYYVIKDGALTSGISWCYLWMDWGEDGSSQNNVDFGRYKWGTNDEKYSLIDDRSGNEHSMHWFRGAIGKVITMSAYTTSGKLSGVLCGDFKLNFVDANVILRLHIASGSPVKQRNGSTPPSLIWKMAPVASTYGTDSSYITVSYRQTGVSSRDSSIWVYPGGWTQNYISTGDFAVTIDPDCYGSQGGRDVGRLWCKNLWFDTSSTI